MNKNGQILIIEDDEDDQEIFKIVFRKINIPNEVIFFSDGDTVLEYLNKDKNLNPFLIISDINLPKLNGLELREKVYNNKELAFRCIPYLFFTTSAAQRDVIDAYSKSVQGFFVKPDSITETFDILDTIVKYWRFCKSPNNTD